MKSYLLGMDRGSTNVKAALYDSSGKEIAIASLPLEPPQQKHPGWAEQDMDQLWLQSAAAVRTLFDSCDINPEQVAAIGFSGHGGGLYAIDADGRPVRPCILSMDHRMQAENCRRIQEGKPEFQTSKVDPAVLLYWLRRYEPENYKRIRWVMASKDWIRYCMTGEAAVSESDFGMSVLLNSGCLDEAVWDCFEIPEARKMVPPCRKAWEVCGTVTPDAAAQTGLLPGTPCIMGGHDCALASFGVGGSQTGHLTAIMGTFAMNMLVSDRFESIPDYAYGRIVGSVLPGKQLYMNSTTSGSSLDWFIRVFCPYEQQIARENKTSVHTVLEEMALQASPANVIWHPFVVPVWDNPFNAHVGLYGADLHTTRNEIVRAVLEGIAFAEVRSLEGMLDMAPVDKLTLTGGGSRSRLWGQIFADILQLPVEIPDIRDAACRGAALLAGIGIGLLKDHETASGLPVELACCYYPSANRQINERYACFCDLINVNKEYWKNML